MIDYDIRRHQFLWFKPTWRVYVINSAGESLIGHYATEEEAYESISWFYMKPATDHA